MGTFQTRQCANPRVTSLSAGYTSAGSEQPALTLHLGQERVRFRLHVLGKQTPGATPQNGRTLLAKSPNLPGRPFRSDRSPVPEQEMRRLSVPWCHG